MTNWVASPPSRFQELFAFYHEYVKPQCYHEIKVAAREARRTEGSPDTEASVAAFGPWERVYTQCIAMQDLYNHPKVTWARRRGFRASMGRHWVGFVLGVCASLVAGLILIRLGLA
jgi:hypothetical protein